MPSNTLATPTWVSKETARYYYNELTFLKNVNREYSDEYVQAGAKVGDTINVRLPQRWTVAEGQGLQMQGILDQTVAVPLAAQKQVGMGWSSKQATTELDSIRQRYIQPAAEALANAAEVFEFNAVYRDIYSSIGVPGTTPSATLTYLQANTKLTDLSTPLDGRVAVLDPLAMQTVANTSSTLFNSIAESNYQKGMFARDQLGIGKWLQDPVRPVHTTGTFTACSPTVNSAGQTGSTINTQSWASGATTLKKGDILTFAGVNSVNPLAYSSNGRLQQFVVTADTSDSSGNITALPISPSIITSGQLQTVDASPANLAAITVWNANPTSGTLATTTSPVSFVFHPDAFAFVTADLVDVDGLGAMCQRVQSKALGFSIRWVQQYQILNDQIPSRLEMLIGGATLQARLACRVQG